MAEVLGIIASAIALSQGIGAVTKGMGKIISLRHAPDEFLDLHNELLAILQFAKRLELIEDSLKNTSLQLPSTTLDHLRDTIRELGDDIGQFKAVVFDHEANAKLDENGERKIRKIKWVRERKKITQLRENVKKRRHFLAEVMTSLQTNLGIAQSLEQRFMAIEIQEIRSNQLPAITESNHRIEERFAGIEEGLGGIREDLSHVTDSWLSNGRFETLTHTLNEIKESVLLAKDEMEGGDNLPKSLQETITSISTKLGEFDHRLRDLEKAKGSQQEDIQPTLTAMQESLADMTALMASHRCSEKEPEQTLQRLIHSTSEDLNATRLTGLHSTRDGRFQQPQVGNLNSVICVQATATLEAEQRCKSYCKCDCHKSTNFKIPGFLSRLVGNLLVSYNSIPVWKPRLCNLKQCKRRTSNRFQLNYMLPQWVVRKCVSISMSWGSVTNTGASLHLCVPRVNPDWNYGFRLLEEGDIASFRRCLTAKRFLLTDVNEAGTTLMNVCLHYHVEKVILFLPSFPTGMLSWKDDGGSSLVRDAYIRLRRPKPSETQYTVYQQILDLTDQDNQSNIIIDAVLGCPDFTVETALNLEPSAINEQDEAGRTALHWAVIRDDIRSVQELLRHGSDVTVGDVYRSTPLHLAAINDNVEMVQLLLEAGSDIEARDRFGATPLLDAAVCNRPDSLDQLVLLGANASTIDLYGRTAFHCLSLGNPRYFKDKSIMLRICQTLQQAGLDVNARGQLGTTPLINAIKKNHVELVKALALCGHSLQILDNCQESVLHKAARYASSEAIQALREMKIASVDPDFENQWGWTAEGIFAYRIHASDDGLVVVKLTKPTSEAVAAFNLLISEIRERRRRRDIVTLRIGYKDWRIADRRCCTQKKTAKSSRRSYSWKALTRMRKYRTYYRSILIEFPRHLLNYEGETSSLFEGLR